METSSTTSGLAFKPWPRNNDEQASLGSILARIQLDRGHFRDITEQSLQEEIATEGALLTSESSGEDELDTDEDEEGGNTRESKPEARPKPTSLEDVARARLVLLQHIRDAQNDIDYARDFISLLVSKDLPRQAASSIAPNLAKEIPLGTLGVDMWQQMPVDKTREAQDDLIATRVRMAGLQKSADDLLAAATRLTTNMQNETQYWDQILSISEQGWNVSKVPGQAHKLGVRFGFNESYGSFSRRSIVALESHTDGSIAFDSGMNKRLKTLQVSMRRNGTTLGTSVVRSFAQNEDTVLETRIRHARDSLFDEELYHEMIFESRRLAPWGVRVEENAIVFPIPGSDMELSFDLRATEPAPGAPDRLYDRDDVAQMAAIAARILLVQAHRDRLAKRSEIPPPMSEENKSERSPLPILRPILAFVIHRVSLEQVGSYYSTLADIFAMAQIKVDISQPRLSIPEHMKISSSAGLVTALMQPWVSESNLRIAVSGSDELSVYIRMETTLANSFGTVFTLQIPSWKEQYQLNNIEALTSAADDKIASLLAVGLQHKAGPDWQFVSREALLVRSSGAADKPTSVQINFSSSDRRLSMKTSDREIAWRADAVASDKGFWEAFGVLIGQ